MILRFPHTEALRLALLSGVVPLKTAQASASAAFSETGAVTVRFRRKLAADAVEELRALGVELLTKPAAPLTETVACWPLLLPLERQADVLAAQPPEGAGRVVLFELPDGQLPELVSEMLRLENDRQSFRRFGEGAAARTLLRVVDPPYYTLLRALEPALGAETSDRAASAPFAVRVYAEQAPHVWTPLGYQHPLADRVQIPDGDMLLLDAPRGYRLLPRGEFRDIYQIVAFDLPKPPEAWIEAAPPAPLAVKLALAESDSTQPAELWVLSGDGVEQLDAFARDADDDLLRRLSFAVSQSDGARRVVLRARPSKEKPPVVVVDGVAMRPYLKLPNLFVPCNRRLHPPLRRDAVSRLLAADRERVTWLMPTSAHGFIPQSLPEEAFRPLDEWVEYVLDQEHEPLEAWMASARFEFDDFRCPDDAPPIAAGHRAQSGVVSVPNVDEQSEEEQRQVRRRETPKSEPATGDSASESAQEVDAQQRELLACEQAFEALEAPLDAPQRGELWRRMATLNAALGFRREATLCWANGLWEQEPIDADHARAWLRCELPGAGDNLTRRQLDALLTKRDTFAAEVVSVLAAALERLTHQAAPAGELLARLPAVRESLEENEPYAPARVIWLAWRAFARLAGNDVLALARARDRLLERLYQQGLQPERDLPSFLRMAGFAEGDRFRAVREHLRRLREGAQQWIADRHYTTASSPAYADLVFAYAMARINQRDDAQALLERSRKTLLGRDEIHRWLFDAFAFRVRQAMDGQASQGGLPPELLDRLEDMDRLPRYKVERLREQSRILEPHERIDPYRRWRARFADKFDQQLVDLIDLTDRDELQDRLRRLLDDTSLVNEPKRRALVVTSALELSPRLGDRFAEGLASDALALLDQAPALLQESRLLERGLFAAAHFGQVEHVQAFVERFHQLLDRVRGRDLLQSLEALVGQCFQGLRKFGLGDEIAGLFRRVVEATASREHPAEADPARRLPRLRVLLQVASGWFYFGRRAEGLEIVDDARATLLAGGLNRENQTALACAYIAALAHAPADLALPRMHEVFEQAPGVSDTYHTASHYSRSQLSVVEAAVLALVSDAFSLNTQARRLLDEDEFLVRRRVHRDVRAAMREAGM